MVYVLRYWRGEISPWIAIVIWILGYRGINLAVATVQPYLQSQILEVLVFLLWFGLLAFGFIALVRSAVRALSHWPASTANGVGGLVALALAAVFVVFTALDMSGG